MVFSAGWLEENGINRLSENRTKADGFQYFGEQGKVAGFVFFRWGTRMNSPSTLQKKIEQNKMHVEKESQCCWPVFIILGWYIDWAQLKSGQIADPEEFIVWARVIFRNCFLFNPDNTAVAKCGEKLSIVFEEELSKLRNQQK